MKKIRIINFLMFLSLSFTFFGCEADKVLYNPKPNDNSPLDLSIVIPAGSNSWVVNDVARNSDVIYDSGIHNWTLLTDVIRTYFKTTGSGVLHVGLKIKSADGASKIKVTVGNETKEITVSNTDYEIVEVGKFNLASSGYHYIEIQGLEKKGNYIGDITEVLIGGSAASSVNFVPTSNHYFGRRGPSVHMGYTSPQGKSVQWFYNEVTVPEGEDKVGSFFMANGHSQGYFGIQVNSETERRVLFSIWSAFETDNPDQIPEEYNVINLGNGQGVTVQNFGNEGSGKQCIKRFDWKAGTTYKFLLKGEPSENNSTDYTAYFFAPEVGEWQFMASLRRPKTSTYLTGLHSFLENFVTHTGYQTRQVTYGNQWVYTTDSQWSEMTKGRFTADATATNKDRLDFDGGSTGNAFFLKNCGFFNANTTPGTNFTRISTNTTPDIDFSKLAELVPQNGGSEPNLKDKTAWTIAAFSSQEDGGGEGNTGRAADILDGDVNTYWHSCWSCSPEAQHPHTLTVDMGAEQQINGVQFIQRQNLSRAIKNLKIEISTDNATWTSKGDFQLENTADAQNIDFNTSVTARYIKITINSSHDGAKYAALGEINVYTY